jgi:hypothetical protein
MLLMLDAPAARAAAPQTHGYWWRLQSEATNLAPPPTVPRRGLWVSNDGTGQHAVSAVRFRAPNGFEIESLVLEIAEETGAPPVLLACPARGSWSDAEAGPWPARPASSCDVAFARGESGGGTVRFDVRGLARNGVLDVVLLAPPDLGTAFSVSFQEPGSGAVVTRAFGTTPSPRAPPSQSSSPRPRPSVLETDPPTPSATPSPSASATGQEPASSTLGDAVRDLADENSAKSGNGFLWLLGGVGVAVAILGWRVRPGRRRPEPPASS